MDAIRWTLRRKVAEAVGPGSSIPLLALERDRDVARRIVATSPLKLLALLLSIIPYPPLTPGAGCVTAHTVGAERVVCLFVAATSTHGLRRGEQTCIGAGNIVHGIVASEDAVGSASGRGSIACCRGLVHGLCRSLASTVGARAIGKLASDADEDKEEECADEATEHDGDYGCFET